MEVIVAKEEHFEDLWPLFELWLASIGSDATKKDALKEYNRVLNDGIFFYIKDKHEIAGFLTGKSVYHFWRNEKAAHEYLWFVHPLYRSKGYGKLLIKMFEGWAKAEGCQSVIITPNKYGSTNPEKGRFVLMISGYENYGYQLRKEL